MATKEQVEAFLKRLKEKIKVFDIIFRDDRGKNLQTLATLEITTTYRKQVIMNIGTEDYVDGPIVDTLNRMGICISFHIAEHPMIYPFQS